MFQKHTDKLCETALNISNMSTNSFNKRAIEDINELAILVSVNVGGSPSERSHFQATHAKMPLVFNYFQGKIWLNSEMKNDRDRPLSHRDLINGSIFDYA